MEPDEIQRLSSKIELEATKALSSVFDVVAQSKTGKEAYAFKVRVKDQDSLEDKLKRKLDEKPESDYSLLSITDVIGLRVVTLFKSEMPKAVREIVELIKLGTRPLETSSIEEVIIYSANTSFDYYGKIIQKNVIELGVPSDIVKLKDTKAGYSSIHLIARLVDDNRFNNYEQLNDYRLPIEIQIRTVFEDAWGEIDHKYGYENRRSQNNEKNKQLLIDRHLRTLKSFTDACGEYADVIEADCSGEIFDTSLILQLDERDVTLELMKSAAVDEKFVKRFIKIEENFEVEKAEFPSAVSELSLKAAEGYRYLYDDAVEFYASNDKEIRVLGYFLRMNEALKRLGSSSPSEHRLASNIYSEVVESYPRMPTPLYRRGLALRKQNLFHESVESFELARELCVSYLEGVDSEEELLNASEITRLRYFIPKNLGYTCWIISREEQRNKQHSERLKFLRKAYEQTLSMGSFVIEDIDTGEILEQKLSCINNLLSYIIEYLNVKEGKDDSLVEELEKQLPELLDSLEAGFDIENSSNSKQIHTVMQTYDYLGQFEKAEPLAWKILDLVLGNEVIGGVTKRMSTSETEIAAQAKNIISRKKKQ